MNKSLLFCAVAVGMIAPGVQDAAAARQSSAPEFKSMLTGLRQQAQRINRAARQDGEIWRPGTVSNYWWDNGAWSEPTTVSRTYFGNGKIESETNADTKTVYAYDSRGRLESQIVYSFRNDEWSEVEKTTYIYDTVIADMIVETANTRYWDGNAETFSDGTEITRNAAGNVTMYRDYYTSNGEKYYDNSKTVIEYGADGKAVSITYVSEYDGDEEKITDIVWESTNGQIVSDEFDDPGSFLYTGANRIKSATVVDPEWPKAAKLTVEYNGRNHHALLMMEGNERLLEINCTYVDEYGSYDATCYEVDYDDDNGQYYIDFTRDTSTTYRIDANGFELEDVDTDVTHENGKDETEVSGMKGIVTTDPTHGYVTEYVRTYKTGDSDTYQNQSREVYSDYTNVYDAAGVAGVAVDNASAPVEYFNLQGVKVANPTNGLYIRRQGTDVRKIVL